MNCNLVTILGHTAAGKTAVAARVAASLGGEIISADSRQVYREMDIGTGKDYDDYRAEGKQVACHLIDIVDAGSAYNVFRFRKDFISAFQDITGRNKLPVLCGGTGMYIESVLRDYRLLEVPVNEPLRTKLENQSMEELESLLRSYGPVHNTTDTSTRKRLIRAIEIADYQRVNEPERTPLPALQPKVFGISFDRANRRDRITQRLRDRLNNGMVEEVRQLMARGLSLETMEYYGLEYKYIGRYVADLITYDEMFSALNTAIHRFAKRQMTYFRGMERRGVAISWLRGEDGGELNARKIAEGVSAN